MADCLAGSVKNGTPLLASTMPSLVLSAQGEASVSCGGELLLLSAFSLGGFRRGAGGLIADSHIWRSVSRELMR